MKKINLFFVLFLFSVKLISQEFPEFSDSMIVEPNWDLIKSRIAYIKNKPTPNSMVHKFVADITDDDMDDIVVINYVMIYPDTLTNDLKYKVDDRRFLFYFKKKNKLLLCEQDNNYPSKYANLGDVRNLHSLSIQHLLSSFSWLTKHSPQKNLFLIYFFPLDLGRHDELLAHKDSDNHYVYKHLLQNRCFESFSSMVEYLFYLPQYYSDIYKKRIKIDYQGWSYFFHY
ncbi:hypothetical protein [Viscerimonas tarda]